MVNLTRPGSGNGCLVPAVSVWPAADQDESATFLRMMGFVKYDTIRLTRFQRAAVESIRPGFGRDSAGCKLHVSNILRHFGRMAESKPYQSVWEKNVSR